MAERQIPVEDAQEQRLLFGSMDRNLRAIRERYGVAVTVRRGTLRVAGDDDEAVREVSRRIASALERARDADDPPTDGEMFSLLLDDPTDPAVDPRRGRERPDARHGFARPGDARSRDGGHREAGAHDRGHRDGGHGGGHADRHGTGQGGWNGGANGGGAGGPGGPAGRRRSLPPLPDVRPLTPRQAAYVEAIRGHDVVFAIGPAGTGKTYLAVSEAVAALRDGKHRKIILTRPAVEAGEKLGYLPGDFQAKINPYLRPLYDALEEMLRYGELQRSIDTDVIEIVPLAYMRGRTLKHAFIILDEAQNTTPAQMKMFLTRLGSESKIVVTGDVTQMDLPDGTPSGLLEAQRVLQGVSGISFLEFQGDDIIRHPMVQRIVDAYERADAAKKAASEPPPPP